MSFTQIHYIRIIAKDINPLHWHFSKRYNKGFNLRTGLPYYIEMMAFNILITQILKTNFFVFISVFVQLNDSK